MKVEMVIISSIGVDLPSLVFDLWSWLLAVVLVKGQRPKTKGHHQILMFRIFLTISIPVTCRNSAATIK